MTLLSYNLGKKSQETAGFCLAVFNPGSDSYSVSYDCDVWSGIYYFNHDDRHFVNLMDH